MAVHRHPAVVRAVVLAVGGDHVVVVERLARVRVAARQPQLRRDRVGLDVDPERRLELLLAQVGGADHVQERVARAVELVERGLAHAVAGALAAHQPQRPAIGEADPLHAALEMSRRVRAVVCDRVDGGVVGPDGVVLHVPDVVAELGEPAEPAQVEPGLPPEGDAPHHPQYDEPESAHAEPTAS